MSHRLSKLSVELLNNISNVNPNITNKWAAGNPKVRVSQKKSAARGLCISYLKAIQGQVSLSTPLGTPKVYIDSASYPYF